MGLRFLIDLREINECNERNPFPLPRIVEALKKVDNLLVLLQLTCLKDIIIYLWVRKLNPMVCAAFKEDFPTKTAVSGMIAKDCFKEHACKECIWRLKLLFFGDDCYGRNASLNLKRTMRKLTPDPCRGTARYKKRMVQFQSYLPYTTCEGLMKKRGVWQPLQLSNDKLQDKLGDNLTRYQCSYLRGRVHNWCEKLYNKTLAVLTLGKTPIIEAMDKAKEQQ